MRSSGVSEQGADQADWYLGDWLSRRALQDSDMGAALGWNGARVSRLISGAQTYTRADVEAICAWLEIWPYELLMPPDLALGLRQLRHGARIVAESTARE